MRYAKAPRGVWLAIGLFFLAPFVGEFVLGNLPLVALPGIVLLAPMYGGGALLIRELARRFGRGWPTMVTLAAAYALLEEGPIDQMLYNPAYLGYDSFAGMAYIPGLDISGTVLQGTLTVHMGWSICVPIALMETVAREPARPWLGRWGLSVTAVAYLAGSGFLAVQQYREFRFMGSMLQFAVSAAVIVGLIAVAFYIGRKPPVRSSRRAPRRWQVAAFGFGVPSAFWAEQFLVPETGVAQWFSVAGWAVAAVGTIVVCVVWSRSSGWTSRHVFALASGALLSYAWLGFAQPSALPVEPSVKLVGNAICAAVAVALVVAIATVTRRREHLSNVDGTGEVGRSDHA